MAILGIDIGGSSVKAAAWEDGRFLWTGQSHIYAKPTTDELRAAIWEVAGAKLKILEAVGLCVPGLLDRPTRQIAFAVNVPGLIRIDLDRLVPGSLDLKYERPATIINDATAAAFELFSTMKLRGRLLAITLGTGVGACVMDDGKPLEVEGESPGHLGQIDVSIPEWEVIGPDGGAGGLEGYIGAAALRKQYETDVSEALAQFTGDEPAIKALVRAIRIAHAIYRPHHICLCGGVGIRLQHLMTKMRSNIELNLTSLARPGWTFTTGDDDFHAARGAALLAQKDLEAGI
ncbi:MAG: ROK family protein [Planctomycetota bacterium]|nr:ROK family protein [Planctomycetota bacterium]